MIKKITIKDDPEQFKRDLERYVELALESGISKAAIVPTEQIVVDERVLMKCRFPLCVEYGKCRNCPPHTGSIADMRAQVARFRYGIFLKLDVPAERIVAPASKGDEGVADLIKLCSIISTVESAAYYDGYYFATGFSSASCHFIWCRGLDCQALNGDGCRQWARVYTSMEAVGIDVFRLAASLDWDIYPIGITSTVDIVPHGSRCGLVLID